VTLEMKSVSAACWSSHVRTVGSPREQVIRTQ